MRAESQCYFAAQAWVGGRWASDVLLEVGPEGCWTEIRTGCAPQDRRGARALPGPVLPGLVNAHSHAFQRAIAGLTERSVEGRDDFWRWRDRMYAVALRITPGQLETIATFLYGELLRAGYTQVCEFHYLHNDADGKPYADPLEMSLALVRAAQRTGIGLTLLPTLYMRSGFGSGALAPEQRRFASTPESVLRIAEALARQAGDTARVSPGIAVHSLRAVDPVALREAAFAARGRMPLHIHVAEQRREVEDCLQHTGKRPIEWLLEHAPVDTRWNLVHATQATADELSGVRACGGAIVLCPSTEANLGDGVFDLPAWMGASGRWSVGSDSHVTRSWQEELRLLEYSQRLVLRSRNVAARASLTGSTATALFEAALEGGSAAAGVPLGGLAPGRRADFVVVDASCASLLGVPQEQMLDALVFSSPDARLSRVFVGGREAVPVDAGTAFVDAMRALGE